MEARQLEAFAPVAGELHWGRAGGKPHLNGLIRRLELSAHAKHIPADFAAAASVRAVTLREDGTVRVGLTGGTCPPSPLSRRGGHRRRDRG